VERLDPKRKKSVKKEKSSSSKKDIYKEVEEIDVDQIILIGGTFNLTEIKSDKKTEDSSK
jgi:hypothetical protein